MNPFLIGEYERDANCNNGERWSDKYGGCYSSEKLQVMRWLENRNVWDKGDPYDDWNRLTQCEKDFFKRHPGFLYAARRDRSLAERAAEKYFPNCRKTTFFHNGIGDAFRHAYFAALNTQQMGYTGAKTLGDCHETELEPGREREKEMDLHNNAWGYAYVLKYGTVNITLFHKAFMEAYRNGNIKILARC